MKVQLNINEKLTNMKMRRIVIYIFNNNTTVQIHVLAAHITNKIGEDYYDTCKIIQLVSMK